MIGTGKYSFKGIRKAGSLGFKALIGSTGWGAKLLTGPFRKSLDLFLEFISELLANRGLLLLNIGEIYIQGKFKQSEFDSRLEKALAAVKVEGLTPEQKKAIDDEVIKAFRPFAHFRK
jgi:hypothetical protein